MADFTIPIDELVRQRRLQNIFGNDLPEKMPEAAPTSTLPTYTPGPAMSAYQQGLNEMPMVSDYHPSKKRNVSAHILAALTGAFQGPKAGIELGNNIKYGPYNQQLGEYDQRLDKLKNLAGLETSGNEQAQKIYKAMSEIEHNKALSNLENTQAANSETPQQRIDIANIAHPPDQFSVTLKDGSTAHNVITKGGKYYDTENNRYLNSDAIKSVSKAGTLVKDKYADLAPDLKKKMQALEIKNNKDSTPEEIAQANSILAGDTKEFTESLRNLHAAYEITQAEEKEPGSQDRAKLQASKDFITNYKKSEDGKTQTFTDAAGNVTAAVVPTVEQLSKSGGYQRLGNFGKPAQPPASQVFYAPNDSGQYKGIQGGAGVTLPKGAVSASGVSQMTVPTSATRGRGEAAQTAIASGNDVINYVKQNSNKLGKVGNYWKELVKNTPVADPFINELRGKIASWAAFQAAAHGFRASTIMHEFEDKVGSSPKNAESIMSVIDGINKELQYAVDVGKGKDVLGGSDEPSKPRKVYNPATGQVEDIK